MVLALLAWSPLAAGIVAFGARIGGLTAGQALLLLVPPLFFGSLLASSAWYICRFAPLSWRRVYRLFFIHGVGGLFLSILPLTLGLLYAAVADLLFGVGWTLRVRQLAPLLLLAGLFVYLLVALSSYLVLAVEESNRRERAAAEERLAAARAELRALRATIQPHFLFNSLTALAALIGSESPLARAICHDLADFLRYTLRRGPAEWATLAEEADHARAYLRIEQARLGDRLAWNCRIEAGLEERRLPALTLLPLVENAVKHGVNSRTEGGAVNVAVCAAGAGLHIEVRNPEPPPAPRPAGAGFGLPTLAARLVLHYGRDIRPRLSRADGWVTVALLLPPAPREAI